MQKKTWGYLVGLMIFLGFILYASVQGIYEYIADSLVFIFFLTVGWKYYKKFNLNQFSYFCLIIAFALHNAGVFGWYNISPLPLPSLDTDHTSPHPFQWDHITHIAGIFAITLVLYRWLQTKVLDKKMLMTFVLLAAMGIGAFVELYEFAGSLIVGEGEGGLGKGGPGDFTYSESWISADWLNTMLDLVYNLLGALVGLCIILCIHKK